MTIATLGVMRMHRRAAWLALTLWVVIDDELEWIEYRHAARCGRI